MGFPLKWRTRRVRREEREEGRRERLLLSTLKEVSFSRREMVEGREERELEWRERERREERVVRVGALFVASIATDAEGS